MLELTQDHEAIIDNTPLAFIKFGAPWCSGCKSIQPTIDNLASQWGDKLQFYYVDISKDNTIDIANKYGIKSLPTFAVTDYGALVTKVGVRSLDEFDLILKEVTNAERPVIY